MSRSTQFVISVCALLAPVWLAGITGCAGGTGDPDSASGGDNQGGDGGEAIGNGEGGASGETAGTGGNDEAPLGGETGQGGAPGTGGAPPTATGGVTAAGGSVGTGGSGGTPPATGGNGGNPASGKPRVFVTTDLTRPGAGSDADDVVTASAMLLILGEFDVLGFNVGAQPKTNCSDAAQWSNANLGAAYKAEAPRLRARFPSYPASINFTLSSFCGKSFSASTDYKPASYPSLAPLFEAAAKGPLYWLIWGELSEAAAGVKWMLENAPDSLKNVTVISHWTLPNRSNCTGDQTACDWMHARAKEGKVKFHELGPIGENGIVNNSCGDNSNLNRDLINDSQIGKFMEEKWSGTPDLSDGATYLVVMGYGGGVNASAADGTYNENTLDPLCRDRPKLWSILEERAKIAAGK